jgi:hypothetical protein
VAVEDEVVEADVEVVGIAGVAGQSVVAVTANDSVVAEITDDPILASGSGELIIAGVPRKSVMPNPSCLCGNMQRAWVDRPVDRLVTAGWQDLRCVGRGASHDRPAGRGRSRRTVRLVYGLPPQRNRAGGGAVAPLCC